MRKCTRRIKGTAQDNMDVCQNVSKCLNSRSPSGSVIQNLLSSVALCSCGPTLTLGKVWYGSDPFQKRAWGQVRRCNTRQFREYWYNRGMCSHKASHTKPAYNPRITNPSGKGKAFIQTSPMSEPEVIENASAAKQDTLGKALIQVFFY